MVLLSRLVKVLPYDFVTGARDEIVQIPGVYWPCSQLSMELLSYDMITENASLSTETSGDLGMTLSSS